MTNESDVPSSDLEALFRPSAIAVIGASANSAKIGHILVHHILHSGYDGAVYPINPKEDEILGLDVYENVADTPTAVDVAIIAVPARFVVDVVEECGEAGVKFLIIVTSGFGEVGDLSTERRIVETAHQYGTRVLGPNIFGIYSAAANLNATFGPAEIIPGNIGLISQSGALGIALMGKTVTEGLGLSAIISVGNKSDLSEVELLDHLTTDDATKSILIYMEGTKDGHRLAETVTKIEERKPIVIIKSGRSAVGAKAAASHTGSLAGSDRVFDSAFRQIGMLRADGINEAFNWMRAFSTQPLPEGENVVIITNGGGVGVMAADACERHHLMLLDDTQRLEKIFRDSVPEFGSTRNPVDITGQADSDAYARALDAALSEERIHAVIGLYCETATVDAESLTAGIAEIVSEYDGVKPVVFSMIGGEKAAQMMGLLNDRSIPAYSSPEEAVSSLGALYQHWRYKRESDLGITIEDGPSFDMETIEAVIHRARAEERVQLLETEAKEVLTAAGLTMPQSRLAHSLVESVEAAESIGYPVVMKVVSPDIVHKTESGGVKLNLLDEQEVVDAYRSIMATCRERFPAAHIVGVTVNEMVNVQKGMETIVGGLTDPAFGPVVMFGLGGIYVEILKDVSFRVAPISQSKALKMVREIRSFPMLYGARGKKIKDIRAAAEAIYRVSYLMTRIDEIAELDINPLIVMKRGKGCKVLDARITLHTQ